MKVLLLSGGLDSALILHRFKSLIDLCVSVDYGQPHIAELHHAQALAEEYGVRWQRVTIAGLYGPTSSGMFRGEVDNPEDTVIPARNALLISIAAAAGANVVFIGCNKDDHDVYPDCRLKFLKDIDETLGVTVMAPLLVMTKKEVVRAAKDEGLDISKTLTCYRGTRCGECAACALLLLL